MRAPYSNFALFAFTTFTLSPFICLNFPLISRHYPPKISNVFRKNSHVFWEISHVFWEISHVSSNISESCGQHSDFPFFLPLIYSFLQLSIFRFFPLIFLDFLLFSLTFLNECKWNACISLCPSVLQRKLWRLWKQKPLFCWVRACTHARETLILHSLMQMKSSGNNFRYVGIPSEDIQEVTSYFQNRSV